MILSNRLNLKTLNIDESINKLINKISSYEFQSNVKKTTEPESGNLASFFGKDSDNDFKKLMANIKELKEENNSMNNKLTLMISVSIISFLAATIALVLRFI